MNEATAYVGLGAHQASTNVYPVAGKERLSIAVNRDPSGRLRDRVISSLEEESSESEIMVHCTGNEGRPNSADHPGDEGSRRSAGCAAANAKSWRAAAARFNVEQTKREVG